MASPEQFPSQPPEGPKTLYKKVPELSEGYQSDRSCEREASEGTRSLFCFGEASLEEIRKLNGRAVPLEERLAIYPAALRERLQEWETRRSLSREEADVEIRNVILRSVTNFKQALVESKGSFEAELILKDALKQPSIRELVAAEGAAISRRTFARYKTPLRRRTEEEMLLAHIFGETGYNDPELVRLLALIGGKRVSTKLWMKILRNHGEDFQHSVEEFEERLLPELTERFRAKMTAAIERGELSIDAERLNRRIAEVSFALRDAVFARLEERSGSFNSEFSQINIAAHLVVPSRRKQLERIFFHEMFHAISGRSIVAETTKYKTSHDEDEHTEYTHQRIGMRFDIEQTKRRRFRWLNEAITEELTIRYTTPDESRRPASSYQKERSLFDFIKNKGRVPIHGRIFINAYFENLDPSLPSAERLPAWKALSKKMEESWGVGFLNRLDAKIKQVGVTKTLDLLEKGEKV